MKVYLEEKDMPKDYKTTCKNCPFRGDEGFGCEERRMLDKDFICPLKSLTDHTKQVRKEVCEEIRKFAYDTFKEFGCFDETDLEHILDAIQGESNAKD